MDAAAGAAAASGVPSHGRPRVQNIRCTKQRSILTPLDEYDVLSSDPFRFSPNVVPARCNRALLN